MECKGIIYGKKKLITEKKQSIISLLLNYKKYLLFLDLSFKLGVLRVVLLSIILFF